MHYRIPEELKSKGNIKERFEFSPFRKAMLKYFKDHSLRTNSDVYNLITWGLTDPIVGTRKNCKNATHCAPFSFLSDVLTGKVTEFTVWANRGGSKSYLAGLITWARSSFIPRYETTILGGSLEQSEKSYKAMQDFWIATGLMEDWLESEPRKNKTVWKNRSLVSVLTASTKSARGPHPHALILDEIDEMDKEVYNAALSQPQSKYGIPSSCGKLSTNHVAGGVMDLALETAKENKLAIYRWCIWEVLESCKDYTCSTCKLSSYCPGKHMKQADGYYKIDDFVKKLYSLSIQTLQVEWFCNKIGRDDLIYGEQFDITIHCAMDVPDYNPALPVYLSIDWGGASPFSLGAWQKFKHWGWVRIDEVYMGNTDNPHIIREAKTRPWWRKVKELVAPPERTDLIKEWRSMNIHVVKAITGVDDGIEFVRQSLKPVLGKPKIYANRARCVKWIEEIQKYAQKNDKPIKENDHAMDETRYFCMRHIRKTATPGVMGI